MLWYKMFKNILLRRNQFYLQILSGLRNGGGDKNSWNIIEIILLKWLSKWRNIKPNFTLEMNYFETLKKI